MIKKYIQIFLCLVAVSLSLGCNDKQKTEATTANVDLSTEENKASYAIGISIGNFAKQALSKREELGIKMDNELVITGFKDAVANIQREKEEVLNDALKKHDDKFQELSRIKSEESLKLVLAESEKFLIENKKKLGVFSTESGLQYEILKTGKGSKPTLDDTVVVHYTGKLINGQVFDSSKERGEPATLKLRQVIPGWAEGLALMSVGSQYRLTIPSEIAFKNQEIGSIPGGSVLIFEVELLDIIKNDEQKTVENNKNQDKIETNKS